MSSGQLSLPQPPRSVDYFPTEDEDEIAWKVTKWQELSAAFHLQESQLPLWHQSLAVHDRYWRIVRRIFGVMAHFGDASEEEDLEDWDFAKLSARLAVPEKTLRDDLAATIEHWEKLCVAASIQRPASAGAPVNPLDSPARVSPLKDIAEEKINDLLEEYRFDYLKKKDRAFVARRLIELATLMEDPNRREPARQLIMMELALSDSETTRALLKSRLETISDKKDLGDKESSELQKIQDSLDKNEISHTKLTEKYLKAAGDLGAEQIEQGELRKVALGTASHFVEAIRQYYLAGDRSLIDGVFAADEIIWETTPLPLRPPQYRPDLVLRINEAMKPENLWNPNYEPSSFAQPGMFKTHREACRRLLLIAKRLVEEEDTKHIPDIDDASASDETEDSTHEDLDPEPAPTDPIPFTTTPSPIITPSPLPREESVMVMG
jgi:hypothetical protein